ncbi:MAG: hypothetical protein KA717_04895 [Woronichinia naegeliana WA131]|uniref:Uncharacterized protein n=1 Tax=Woronichinia naegeliana WA131 TaxID=2824559 RepID=A0A977PXE5_9CYAN|nr:MAG: hypothetical protein KA717_04895 [Woronichinia naegeliana WA131]
MFSCELAEKTERSPSERQPKRRESTAIAVAWNREPIEWFENGLRLKNSDEFS